MILQKGKINLLLDQSWGSSAKGACVDRIAVREHIDFAMVHHVKNACLTSDVYIYTKDGIKTIGEICDHGFGSEKRSFNVVNMKGEYEHTSKSYNNGPMDVLTIQLKNGVILKATPTHKFYVWNGEIENFEWVESKNLNSEIHQFIQPKENPEFNNGEYIKVNYMPNTANINSKNFGRMSNIPEYVDEKMAFILGYLVGDGNYSLKNYKKDKYINSQVMSFAINGDQMDTIGKTIYQYLDEYGINHNTRKVGERNCYTVNISNADFRYMLENVGLTRTKEEFKHVPWSIMKSPKSVIRSFIAGIIESDGSVKITDNDLSGRVDVCGNISKTLVKEIQILMQYLGYRTKWKHHSNVSRNNSSYINKKDFYSLEISNYNGLLKLKEEIPLIYKNVALDRLIEHKKGLEDLKFDSTIITLQNSQYKTRSSRDTTLIKNGHVMAEEIKKYYFFNIVDIYDGITECVYDITVDNTHSYIANGIISHNSHITVYDEPVNGFTTYKFVYLPACSFLPNVKVIIGGSAAFTVPDFLKEIKDWNLDGTGKDQRLFIHPTASVINDENIQFEEEHLGKIGSTMTGGGAAKAAKLLRVEQATTADQIPELAPYIANTHELAIKWLQAGETGIAEICQGFDLSLDNICSTKDGNIQKFWPYCTSRNINPGAFLGESFIPPKFMGSVILNMRTYPIRVGDASTGGSNNAIKFDNGAELPMKEGTTFKVSYQGGIVHTVDIEQMKDIVKKYNDIMVEFEGSMRSVRGITFVGSSGPIYPDQEEVNWQYINENSGSPIDLTEKTSLTKRIRRVFKPSITQLKNSTMCCMPTHFTINFVNYLDYSIWGKSGKMRLSELIVKHPKVAEFVEWVMLNQYYSGTANAATVPLLGTGPKRSEVIELILDDDFGN